jgi:hypothetical protein
VRQSTRGSTRRGSEWSGLLRPLENGKEMLQRAGTRARRATPPSALGMEPMSSKEEKGKQNTALLNRHGEESCEIFTLNIRV